MVRQKLVPPAPSIGRSCAAVVTAVLPSTRAKPRVPVRAAVQASENCVRQTCLYIFCVRHYVFVPYFRLFFVVVVVLVLVFAFVLFFLIVFEYMNFLT